MRTIPAALAAALLASSFRATHPAPAGPPVTAYVHAKLLPMTSAEIPDGALVVKGGEIAGAGAFGTVRIPKDATIVDLAGKTVMPGIVDTHSHVGGGWGGDSSAPIQPDVRVLDSVDCRNPGFQRAQAGGITTLNVMPGSGHLVSGQTVYLKNRDANSIEEMEYLGTDGEPLGGMKFANGTNSQRDPPFPGTRSKSAALVREQLVKAQAYREKLKSAKKGEEPERDLAMEALVEVLDGKRIVHHHTHRHDDILTVLRLQKEFGFKLVLHHVSEAWKVADEIAAAHVPCSVIVLDSPGGKIEAKDISFTTGGVLERAGVNVSFHTDDWITDSRLLLRSAALAVRGGMTREGALKALTINPATQLELQDRIGSLDVGKDADFVVLSGDPLSAFTRVEQTFVAGTKVFDLDNPQDRLWAEGGWGAGERHAFHACCFADGDREEDGR
jgi:imidazolonepropionase-like amidohydrolase